MINSECSLCFEKINKEEYEILPCKHIIHKDCIFNMLFDGDITDMAYITPVNNRLIRLNKKNKNIFICPRCKIEYSKITYDLKTHKILAKIYFKNDGDDLVHYITHPQEIFSYVPMSEVKNDEISPKWCEILTNMRTSWEMGDTDIYAVFRLKTLPEYILCNNRFKTLQIDDITGCAKNGFRMVEAVELNSLINDI